MKVLVIGATGVIGRSLVPRLAGGGHHVLAASRRPPPGTFGWLEHVTPVSLDLLDEEAVHRTVLEERPDAVVHVATAIPAELHPRRIGRQFAATNRLRAEGTRILADAVQEAGVSVFLAQGLAHACEPGDTVRAEEDPLWRDPPRSFAPVVAALRALEERTRAVGGAVLRLGHLYGPGTAYGHDGAVTAMVRARNLPLVGKGRAWFSFIHVDDAASAFAAALDRREPGTFNVADDDAARASEWVPWMAEALGADPPRRVPRWLARLVVGSYGVTYLDGLAAVSTARARQVLGWSPRYPSWRDGMEAELRG